MDGVAMRSPLGPSLIFSFIIMRKFGLENAQNNLNPNTTYVDDIFLLFDDSSQINKFEKYMNSRHKNIKFTKEIEKIILWLFWQFVLAGKVIHLRHRFIVNPLLAEFTLILIVMFPVNSKRPY